MFLVSTHSTGAFMPRGPEPKTPRPAWSTALRTRRIQLNLKQEDVSARTNDEISQGTISDLERGKTDLVNMTSARLTALANALEWTLEEMEQQTGAALTWSPVRVGDIIHVTNEGLRTPPPSETLSAAALYRNIPIQDIEVPDSLQEAARLYGDLPAFAGIRDARWQQFMLGGGHGVSRKRTPVTPEEWVEEFTALKRMGFGPDELKE